MDDIIRSIVDEISATWPQPSSGITAMGFRLKRATIGRHLRDYVEEGRPYLGPTLPDRAELLALAELLYTTNGGAWSHTVKPRSDRLNWLRWRDAAQLLAARETQSRTVEAQRAQPNSD